MNPNATTSAPRACHLRSGWSQMPREARQTTAQPIGSSTGQCRLLRHALGAAVGALLAGTLSAPPQAQPVYVDGCASGPGLGLQFSPYENLNQAAAAAPAGSTLIIQAGSYSEPLMTANRLTFIAPNGPVLVGAQFVGTQEVCVPIKDDSCGWASFFNPEAAVSCDTSQLGVRARVYYPAAGPDNSRLACGGPFPLIVYAHGNRLCSPCAGSDAGPPQDDYRQAEGILRPLASAGFIVMSVDVSWFLTENPKATIVLNALAFARDENARSGSRFRGTIDMTRVGLLGHSTGGSAVVQAERHLRERSCATSLGLGNVQPGALALFAPGFTGSAPVAPLLVLFGTADSGQVSDGPLRMYENATGPKHLVVVTGANHYGYTDTLCCSLPSDGVCMVGGLTGPEAQHNQQRTARNYVGAFFATYLQGDITKRDFLVQQSGEHCGNPGNPPGCGPPRRAFDDLNSRGIQVSVCSCIP